MAQLADSEPIDKMTEALKARAEKENVDFADILGLAEVMVESMKGYFTATDKAVYREFREISDHIMRTRQEIAALQPKDLQRTRLPRAGQELDAIVKQTEEATNTIMNAAELIMSADPSDPEAFNDTVQTNILQIFEACSFQDITGQRISRVVETLKHIESRVTHLADAFGLTDEDEAHEETEEERRRRELILNGPQLAGEGVDQSDVDALFSEEPSEASSQSDVDALFD